LFTGQKKPEGFGASIRGKLSGANHWNWQGGKVSETVKIRNSWEYRQWRKAVYERDNYTCTQCGARSSKGEPVKLNADHIKPFARYPELRFDLDNGRTLCLDCHIKTPTFGNRAGAHGWRPARSDYVTNWRTRTLQ
jgi:5-methylcytosine-specific restriction endonuclease McrA